MYASLNKKKENESKLNEHLSGKVHFPNITNWINTLKAKDTDLERVLKSQIILFNSRKKWGLLFALATVSGLFCVPLSSGLFSDSFLGAVFKDVRTLEIFLLPLSTLLIITGMYVFNDLMDADLDRINGKTKRPIPSGNVPKSHALIFIIAINLTGISLPLLMGNMGGLLFTLLIALIGVLYSLPKISLKDRFVIKTLAIALAMMCALLLGSSIYLDSILRTDAGNLSVPLFAGVIVALMVFVTSPLNDLGDVVGDKETGRRTIPIVIGNKNTVWLSLVIVLGMAILSWSIYGFEILSIRDNGTTKQSFNYGRLVLPLAITFVSILITVHLSNILKKIDNQSYLRDSVTKKSIPLHILVQLSIVTGCLLL